MRSAECGARSLECGARSLECECGVRSAERRARERRCPEGAERRARERQCPEGAERGAQKGKPEGWEGGAGRREDRSPEGQAGKGGADQTGGAEPRKNKRVGGWENSATSGPIRSTGIGVPMDVTRTADRPPRSKVIHRVVQ
ncbi:hypothetical protein Aph01nite_02760 [Acrocarpospora phusangensis]|uniref:Uncharacterized protein n=1 Tax=Acrocarpospora phusangensis TaxID=1070424 RepID=A0A919Q5G4_9ACTN|nr:hypothetical protein Aph01nite_02760 [Acrocarpospora phusangensis]